PRERVRGPAFEPPAPQPRRRPASWRLARSHLSQPNLASSRVGPGGYHLIYQAAASGLTSQDQTGEPQRSTSPSHRPQAPSGAPQRIRDLQTQIPAITTT